MKPNVHKVKNVQGRMTGYKASVGAVNGGQHETPSLAVDACDKEILAALYRLDRGTRIFAWRGHTIVVSPTVNGWDYWIDTSTQGHGVASVPCGDREAAEDYALHHLAQGLWTHDVANDETLLEGLPPSVQAELRPWIRFQRRYRDLRSQGLSDTDAHRQACEASRA